MNKLYLPLIIALLIGVIAFQRYRYDKVSAERDTYRTNTETLLYDVRQYRARDSINVVSIGELSLKVSEYEKYRADDAGLIKSLEVDAKRLQQVITTQTQTIYRMESNVKDSLVYIDSYITDTLQCISMSEKWYDFQGCIDKEKRFSGIFENRDSLVYVEHIIPKRFLWIFKYGVKERRQEMLSKNPNTRIVGAEFITIRK
jgi:hypothetical protein